MDKYCAAAECDVQNKVMLEQAKQLIKDTKPRNRWISLLCELKQIEADVLSPNMSDLGLVRLNAFCEKQGFGSFGTAGPNNRALRRLADKGLVHNSP